jgi:hypothetical protein
VKKLILTTVVFGLATTMAADALAFPRIFRWRRNVSWSAPAPVVTTTAQTDAGYRSYSYEPAPMVQPALEFRAPSDRTAIRDTERGFREAGDKINFRY